VLRGADDAVSFQPRLDPAEKKAVDAYFRDAAPGTLFFGLNLRRWGRSRESYARIASAVEGFAAALTDRPVRVLFVPMETQDPADDRQEGFELAKSLSWNTDYRVVTEALSVEQKFYLIGRLDLFAGMRLHSLVFSLACGVPTLGLYQNEYYFRKVSGLFESFAVEGAALPLAEIEKMEEKLRSLYGMKTELSRSLIRTRARLARDQKNLLAEVMQ
jgi:polysaccharide pyruvyl transferase WcaK-like protein